MKKKIVLTGGVFDIIHPGHVFLLEQAKKLGDVLVVVIASDETVRKIKKRKPIHSAQARARIVSALKPVDKAVVGSPKDKLAVVRKIKPHVIAFGYDQPMKGFEGVKGVKLKRISRKLNGKAFKTSKIIAGIRGK